MRTRSVAGFLSAALLVGIVALLASCASLPSMPGMPSVPFTGDKGAAPAAGGPTLSVMAFSDSISPAAAGSDAPGITIAAARNESTSFSLQLGSVPRDGSYTLRVRPPQMGSSSIPGSRLETYQILPMPVDVNRAGYVRHTGQSAAVRDLPRALLPVGNDNGLVNLRALCDPGNSAPLQIWVDLHVPDDTPAGDYASTCDVIHAKSGKAVSSVPLRLTVYDFSLPTERHLQVVGRVDWKTLIRLYPDRFETVTPRLLSRSDAKYAPAVKTLDGIMSLAQRNRVSVAIPTLQPTVKWPAGAPPQVDWSDFDSVAGPWLRGDAFADKVPVGFWPLPSPDFLDRFDAGSQREYWANAANHFEQMHWLDRAPVWIEKATPGRVRAADAVELSARANDLLKVDKKLRVLFPLENDQVQIVQAGGGPGMVDIEHTDRLWAAAPGLVFSPPAQLWAGHPKMMPRQWLRTDTPGLVPYAGAGGDERDVRLWAWLAFLRNASLIVWSGVLPSLDSPQQPADPNELIWFYPGEWFGVDGPVPTVQLKWLRGAQQDYEYLRLAADRGELLNTLVMARLMTKLVQIQPGNVPDPSYALMCGTTDAKAWVDAQRLLAKSILLRPPGADPSKAPDADRQHALHIETLRWVQPQERPLLMGRTTQWYFDDRPGDNGDGVTRVRLRLGIDIYNASDTRPDKNEMQWTSLPPGWQVRPQPIEVPALSMFDVRREQMDGSFDLSKITRAAQQPSGLQFVNGFTKGATALKVVLPVAATERLEGRRLNIDGKLDEWAREDLIQDGPMVKMLSRPLVQQQGLEPASVPAKVYSGWAADNFYLAFDLRGAEVGPFKGSQNFVNYQFRRAWGEDLVEVVIQPVYEKTVGPVMHLVCKPTGTWVERKLDPRQHANPWDPMPGVNLRYKASIDGDRWIGEVAIPWNAITDPNAPLPRLLRFNFVQHRHATGESASWAGPIDFGRDDSFTGVLHVREADQPGVAGGGGARAGAYGEGD
jgi:hypothetical protein